MEYWIKTVTKICEDNIVEENIETSKSDSFPVVITRRNRQETGDSLCIIKLDDFLVLYKLLIKEKGMND